MIANVPLLVEKIALEWTWLMHSRDMVISLTFLLRGVVTTYFFELLEVKPDLDFLRLRLREFKSAKVIDTYLDRSDFRLCDGSK